MDNERLELLKQDLISLHFNRYSGPTREEIEIIVTNSIDAITDMAKDIVEKAIEEHATSYKHDMREGY